MLRTARQRKVLCRDCPVARVADLVGDSVSLLIVRDLLLKSRRFTDFELAYQGVSSRTLALKLKALEKEGLIVRDDSKRHVPRVDYRLTSRGRALEPVIDSMRSYGKKYL
jgi:DNA-binding HxlR family transcriptional regulator